MMQFNNIQSQLKLLIALLKGAIKTCGYQT